MIRPIAKGIALATIAEVLLFSNLHSQSLGRISFNITNQLGNRKSGDTIRIEQVENRDNFYTAIVNENGQAVLSNVPVPIELMNFNANYNANNNIIELNWKTASETNNLGFRLEQRINEEWKELGFVAGNGTTNTEKNYNYNVNIERAGNYEFKLIQQDFNGKTTNYLISVNVPNPKADLGKITPSPGRELNASYKVNERSKVKIKVYNILGQEVRTLVDEAKEAGYYSALWDGKNNNGILVSSGIYIFLMETDNFKKAVKGIYSKNGITALNSFIPGAFLEDIIKAEINVKSLNKNAGIFYDIIFTGSNILTDTLKNVELSSDTTINKIVTQVINAGFNVKDLFSEQDMNNATLTSGTAIAHTDSNGNASLRIPINIEGIYSVTIDHDSSYQRVMKFQGINDTLINETIIPLTFNMKFFDEVARSRGITQRWLKQPKFYLVNVPLDTARYDDGTIHPANKWIVPQEMLDSATVMITRELPKFTDGFVKDPVIEIGNDPVYRNGSNDPSFYYPKLDERLDGWVVVQWKHAGNPGSHGEWFKEGVTGTEIINGRIKFNTASPAIIKQAYMQEFAQVMGARQDDDSLFVEKSIFHVTEEAWNYVEFLPVDLQLGKILYRRPPGSTTPDRDP